MTAPVYDNASSLFPGVLRVLDEYRQPLSRKRFLFDRIIVFPASMFKIRKEDRSYRSNYYEMFSDTDQYEFFSVTAAGFRENNDWRDVLAFMKELVCELEIDPGLKRFYAETEDILNSWKR